MAKAKDIDALLSMGEGSAMQTQTQDSKKYATKKHLTGMNPAIEKFYDENLAQRGYSSYAAFVKKAIYELAIKEGFHG